MNVFRSIYNWFICPNRMLSLRRHVPTSAALILDVGCGNHSSRLAKTYFPLCRYHGVDKQRWNWNADDDKWTDRMYEIDLEQTGSLVQVPDGQYDAVICSHVLEHLSNPYAVVLDLARKAKAGGVVYVEVPSERSLRLPRACSGWWGIHGCLNFYDDDSHKTFVKLDEVASILENNGFRVVHLGRCWMWRRVIFLPAYLVACFFVKGFIPASVVWDITGFAERLTAIRFPLGEGGTEGVVHR